jgi:hypothetical protein
LRTDSSTDLTGTQTCGAPEIEVARETSTTASMRVLMPGETFVYMVRIDAMPATIAGITQYRQVEWSNTRC